MTTQLRAEASASAEKETAPPPPDPSRMALMVTEEEAEALMSVLLLAPMEDGAFGGAMERVLERLAEVQRAFAREEIP